MLRHVLLPLFVLQTCNTLWSAMYSEIVAVNVVQCLFCSTIFVVQLMHCNFFSAMRSGSVQWPIYIVIFSGNLREDIKYYFSDFSERMQESSL